MNFWHLPLFHNKEPKEPIGPGMDRPNPMYGTAPSLLISFLKEAGYKFVTPTPATHRRVNVRPENKRAENLSDVFGWNRPFADPCFQTYCSDR